MCLLAFRGLFELLACHVSTPASPVLDRLIERGSRLPPGDNRGGAILSEGIQLGLLDHPCRRVQHLCGIVHANLDDVCRLLLHLFREARCLREVDRREASHEVHEIALFAAPTVVDYA